MSYSVNSTRPLKKWQIIALIVGVLGLIVLTLVLPIIAQNRNRAAYPDIAAAKYDATEFLEKLGTPPDTKAQGFRTLDSGPKGNTVGNAGKAWLSWTQSYESQTAFSKVTEWYATNLQAARWSVHQPASETSVEFCEAPFLLKISRTGNEGTGCRYELRLEWNNQFSPGTCQHP